MSNVQETFTPKRLAASGALFSGPGLLGGFLCTSAGTVVVSTNNGGAAGTEIISSITVVAGTYYPMPFAMADGAYATLGSGAIGTFGIGQ